MGFLDGFAAKTRSFELRPMRKADITVAFGQWLSDPEVAQALNTRPQVFDQAELARYVENFNHSDRAILGLFERHTASHMGLSTAVLSDNKRHVLINMLIAKGARHGSKLMEMPLIWLKVFDTLFYDRDLQSAVASVRSDNRPMLTYLHWSGWHLAGNNLATQRAAKDKPTILRFRITKDLYSKRWQDSPLRKVDGDHTL